MRDKNEKIIFKKLLRLFFNVYIMFLYFFNIFFFNLKIGRNEFCVQILRFKQMNSLFVFFSL